MRGLLSNFIDILHIIIGYQGTGYLLIVYLAAVIYLFITEKESKNRILLLYIPLIIMLIILCPIYYRIYMGRLDDSGTYYRMMWLLPITATIAYAGCKAIMVHRRIGAILVAVLIALCGKFTYTAVENTRAQNLYHIPQYVIEIADNMTQDIEGVNICAIVPLEMLFYVRQYDSDINLLYGREAVEPKWGYYDEYFELFELAEVLDWNALLEKTRSTDLGTRVVSYFVVAEDRDMMTSPEDAGLEKVMSYGGYVLYRDPIAVSEVREMLVGTSYMQ